MIGYARYALNSEIPLPFSRHNEIISGHTHRATGVFAVA